LSSILSFFFLPPVLATMAVMWEANKAVDKTQHIIVLSVQSVRVGKG
jgi:hypothetical protein